MEGQSITFEYGTITGVNRPKVKVIQRWKYFKERLTMFHKRDDNATQLFEFMANPGVTTTVEWSHVKQGQTSQKYCRQYAPKRSYWWESRYADRVHN